MLWSLTDAVSERMHTPLPESPSCFASRFVLVCTTGVRYGSGVSGRGGVHGIFLPCRTVAPSLGLGDSEELRNCDPAADQNTPAGPAAPGHISCSPRLAKS